MGTAITTNTWYNHTSPYFDWPAVDIAGGATDGATGSGVAGYFVYFGSTADANPETLGTLTTNTYFTASSLVSGTTYYLRIKTIDDAGNVSDTAWPPFIYKFDSTGPTLPTNLASNPSGYSATDSFDFSWTASTDTGSQGITYCYKTGASSGDYSTDQCGVSTSVDDVPSYVTGANTFYVRSRDGAGNYSSYATVSYYYNSTSPSPPQSLDVTPDENTDNSFAFSWDEPAVYFGSESGLTYYYSVNALPTLTSSTSTLAKLLVAGAYATLPGQNTFYVVAKDEAGNIDWTQYSSVTFTANTTAPGIPVSMDIADVSVKSTSSWKIAVSWEEPLDVGSGVGLYKLYRSTDNSTFSYLASTAGISYVDTRLSQTTYYYKVQACDNANNCGAFSSVVSLYPDGKFTEAAPLVGEPEVTDITTKKATISWTTSRTADSKIAYGTSSGDYGEEEVANSDQVTSHSLDLSNLSPGTTYYFEAKWTDEDGNTGISDEYEFDTEPAPSATEITAIKVGLTSATIKFTSKNGSTAKIYFGKSADFGGVKEISISTSETTYEVSLDELTDGSKYYYKVNLLDVEDAEYEGDTYSFQTLPKPTVNNVVITQVKTEAQPTLLITWSSNTEISSIVTYYPAGSPGQAKDEVNVSLLTGKHRMLLKGLIPETPYRILVSGKDKAGNAAYSGELSYTTSSDTRKPVISGLKIEGSIVAINANTQEKQAQLVITWDTDEPTTSQVEFGEGSGSTYAQKTQEDTNLAYNHVVVISNLTPSKVYHLRALSNDRSQNLGASVDTVTITPKATDNAMDLVVSSLSQVFGFLGTLNK